MKADSAVKLTLDLTPDEFKIPYTDMKLKINTFLHAKWQQHWNNNINNQFFLIKRNKSLYSGYALVS